jgi:hypothetical protein
MTTNHEDAVASESAEDVRTERTIAFFADPQAATLLLTDTVARLIDAMEVQRGLVDLSSLPGLAVAAAFEREGVPYEALDFGQSDQFIEWMSERDPLHNPFIEEDADHFRSLAVGVKQIPFDQIGSVDANVVLIPAMVPDGKKMIDFSPESLPGAVMNQLEEAQRPMLIIDTPERGLRHSFEGIYQREIIHVAAEANAA